MLQAAYAGEIMAGMMKNGMEPEIEAATVEICGFRVFAAPIPPAGQQVIAAWQAVAGPGRAPECCLVNVYGEGARMGLHQHKDETLFRMGGVDRTAGTQGIWLRSGDVVLMGGAARLAWNRVDRVRHGLSRLLPQGGRLQGGQLRRARPARNIKDGRGVWAQRGGPR